jgi:hypothetical protein
MTLQLGLDDLENPRLARQDVQQILDPLQHLLVFGLTLSTSSPVN